MKNLKIVVAALLMSMLFVFHANAATVERTTNKTGHVIDSFYMMCRVVDVQNDGIKYIITVEDNSGNKWEFFDSRITGRKATK